MVSVCFPGTFLHQPLSFREDRWRDYGFDCSFTTKPLLWWIASPTPFWTFGRLIEDGIADVLLVGECVFYRIVVPRPSERAWYSLGVELSYNVCRTLPVVNIELVYPANGIGLIVGAGYKNDSLGLQLLPLPKPQFKLRGAVSSTRTRLNP